MNTKEMLAQITCSTFQDTAFVFLESEDDDWVPDNRIVATISFRGGTEGQMALGADVEGSGAMAANLLGIEEDDVSAEQRKQAVSEMLNILCGVFLEAWYGDNTDWSMGIPKTEIRAADEMQSLVNAAWIHCPFQDEEGHRIDVLMMSDAH